MQAVSARCWICASVPPPLLPLQWTRSCCCCWRCFCCKFVVAACPQSPVLLLLLLLLPLLLVAMHDTSQHLQSWYVYAQVCVSPVHVC
jgi:hypothetical protein